jgi:Tfp pilus assembly protein PilN
MRAVNLLPKDLQAGGRSIREEDPAVVVGAALGAIVMIALIASFVTAHGKANAEQKKLVAARIEYAQVSEDRKQRESKLKPVKPSAPLTPIVPPPAVTGQEATWLTSVSQVLDQRIAWDRILREVSLVMPSDVTLNALTMTAPVVATPGTAAPSTPVQGFTITGTAFSYDSVARLLSRLALVPDLDGVTLSNSSAGGAGDVQFSISAAVKGAPAPVVPVTPVVPASTDTTSTEATS